MSDWFEAFKGVWGLLMTGAGWIAVRQMNRIDTLEEKGVKKEDHEREVTRLRDEHQRNIEEVRNSIRDLRQETNNNFNRVFDRLDTIADSIK